MEPNAAVSVTARSAQTTTVSLLTQSARLTTMTRSTAQASSEIFSRLSSSQTVLANPSVGVGTTQTIQATNTHKTAIPVPTESPNRTNASQDNTNTALYIGVIVSLVALLLIVAMTAVVTVVCVSVKKKTTPGK